MNVTKILGGEYPIHLIVNSFLFSLILFFSILYIGSYIQPTVYPLIDRVTYSTPFTDKYFIDQYKDTIIIIIATLLWFGLSIRGKKKYIMIFAYAFPFFIAITFNLLSLYELITLTTLPVIIFLILFDSYKKKGYLSINKTLYLKFLGFGGLLIGIISIFVTLFSIIQPDVSLPPINHLYYIYLLLSTCSPILLLLVSFYYPFKVVLTKIKSIHSNGYNFDEKNLTSPKRLSTNFNTTPFYLFSLIFFSIIITSLPHFPTINTDNQIIGSDSKEYTNLLIPLYESKNPIHFLENAFIFQSGGDRPFSLIFFFLFTSTINSIDLTDSVEFLPLFLGPALIIVIYFLTLEISSNQRTSLLASFLTVISFHLTIGTYAGFYANWFSLIFGYLAILFMIKLLKYSSSRYLIYFSLLMILVLFSHAPTWTILSICIILFLVLNLKLSANKKKLSVYLLLAIVPSIIIDLLRMVLIKSSGILTDIAFAKSQEVGLHDFSYIWNSLINTTQISVAGQFGNPIIFILILYWLYLSRLKENISLIFVIFFLLSIPPILFGNADIIVRVLYEIPFQIPAAMGLMLIKEKYGSMFFITICLWLVVISLRAFSNFYFINQ